MIDGGGIGEAGGMKVRAGGMDGATGFVVAMDGLLALCNR
jgi:hypothetical protein